jgi:16S rRNA (guanine527-N7)-methyltransferase
MNSDMEILATGMSRFGITFDQNTIQQFYKYLLLLIERNETVNLTAITDTKEILIQHFLDSLSVLTIDVLKPNMKVIDIGSGAGFPGIPLKIIIPELQVVLADSTKKRVAFMEEVTDLLKLKDITAIHGRAEDLSHNPDYRESFQIAVSRAVADLRVLCELCLPFVQVGGLFLSYKGPKSYDELEMSENALNILGGKVEGIRNIKVPYSQKTHNIIVIQKVEKTPKKYPRKPGKPKKSPL